MDHKNIYLARAVDTNDYKIGVTKQDPKLRLKQLQTGNSLPLVLIKSLKTKYGHKAETALHRFFASKKVDGEWFRLEQSDIEQFKNRCRIVEQGFDTLVEYENPFF